MPSIACEGSNMRRKAVIIGSALVVAAVVTITAPAISASASTRMSTYNPVGTGITTCPVDGNEMTFSPPLANSGTATSETVSILAAGKPCTGGTPVPAEYKLKATSTITGTNVNVCTTFFGLTPATVIYTTSFSGNISYTNAAPSALFSSHLKSTETIAAAPIKFKMNPIKITGSYPTVTGSLKFKSILSQGTISSSCGSGGVAAIDIANTGGSGTF
jgi:hypothetical protein